MIGQKLISSKSIIGKLLRDFQHNSGDFIANAYEWIGDAVQALGYFPESTVKVEKICIKDNYGCLPCDLQYLKGVLYKDKRLPLGTDTSKYGIVNWRSYSNLSTLNVSDENELILSAKALTSLQEQLTDYLESGGLVTDATAKSLQERIDDYISKIETISTRTTLINRASANYENDYYNINLDKIVTSFEEGEIYVIYGAFPVDSEGFPMILDEFNYKEAIIYFIMYKLNMRRNNITQAKEFFQMYEIYSLRATNRYKMPNEDEMEQFKNFWTSAKPIRDNWSNFFIGSEQNNYTSE